MNGSENVIIVNMAMHVYPDVDPVLEIKSVLFLFLDCYLKVQQPHQIIGELAKGF